MVFVNTQLITSKRFSVVKNTNKASYDAVITRKLMTHRGTPISRYGEREADEQNQNRENKSELQNIIRHRAMIRSVLGRTTVGAEGLVNHCVPSAARLCKVKGGIQSIST